MGTGASLSLMSVPHRLRRGVAVATIAAGLGLVGLSLSGMANIDSDLRAAATPTQTAPAQTRYASYDDTWEHDCPDKDPAPAASRSL